MVLEKFIKDSTSVDEEHMSVAVKLAEETKALTKWLIEAFTKAGTENGIESEQSRKIVSQAVLGSAKMMEETKEHPFSLIDKVCSPQGTTIEGLLSLQKNGFEKKIIEIIDESLSK